MKPKLTTYYTSHGERHTSIYKKRIPTFLLHSFWRQVTYYYYLPIRLWRFVFTKEKEGPKRRIMMLFILRFSYPMVLYSSLLSKIILHPFLLIVFYKSELFLVLNDYSYASETILSPIYFLTKKVETIYTK